MKRLATAGFAIAAALFLGPVPVADAGLKRVPVGEQQVLNPAQLKVKKLKGKKSQIVVIRAGERRAAAVEAGEGAQRVQILRAPVLPQPNPSATTAPVRETLQITEMKEALGRNASAEPLPHLPAAAIASDRKLPEKAALAEGADVHRLVDQSAEPVEVAKEKKVRKKMKKKSSR